MTQEKIKKGIKEERKKRKEKANVSLFNPGKSEKKSKQKLTEEERKQDREIAHARSPRSGSKEERQNKKRKRKIRITVSVYRIYRIIVQYIIISTSEYYQSRAQSKQV